MDRAEKRRLDREHKKNQQWFDSLPLDKKIFVGNFIESQTIQNDNLVAAIMDKCIMGSMDDNLDVDDSVIKKIIKESNDYILDYKLYLDKEGYEEGFNMIENLELREKVKAKIRQYMNGKMDKAKGLRLLRNEFNLPNAELSDLWMECKPGGKKMVKSMDKKKEEFLEEVALTNENILNKEIVVNGSKDVKEEVEVILADGIHVVNGVYKVSVNNSTRKSKLKIVNTFTEVDGEYGSYVKSPRGVAIGDRLYENVSSVDDEEWDVRKKYEAEMSSIEKQISELNDKLEKIREEGKKKLEGFTELREVFNL